MSYLKIRTPEVVHETVDGEVVIVNLDKGLYFSTDQIGACIWSKIVSGQDTNSIVAWASDTYGGVESAAADAQSFLDALRSNDLVTESGESAGPDEAEEVSAPEDYARPELQVFSDMEDLLLLDPIHDVEEEKGWPNTAS